MAATKKKEAAKVKYSKEQYMYWYESMQLQRKFEEKQNDKDRIIEKMKARKKPTSK